MRRQLLAWGYNTEIMMWNDVASGNATKNLDYISRLDGKHVTWEVMGPLDPLSYMSNGHEVCPASILSKQWDWQHACPSPSKQGFFGCYCLWNGRKCVADVNHNPALSQSSLCGVEYLELFNKTTDTIGAEMYPYPACPECVNASCQLASLAPPHHICGGNGTISLRDPHEQPCASGKCWSTGYDTQILNLTAGMCEGRLATHHCKRNVKRKSVWPVTQVFSWATTGYPGVNNTECKH